MIVDHSWGCRTIDYPVEPAPRILRKRPDPSEDPTDELPVLTIHRRSGWSLRASQLLHVLGILLLVGFLVALGIVVIAAALLAYSFVLLSGIGLLLLLR